MFLFWQKSRSGSLFIDEEGVKRLLDGFFPEGYSVKEVSVWWEKDLLVLRMAYPLSDVPVSNEYLERLAKDAQAFLAPLGFSAVEVAWVGGESVPVDEKTWRKYRNDPLTWGIIVGALAMLAHLGGRGVFWTLLLSVLGYGVAWLFLTPRGGEVFEKMVKTVKG